MNNSNKKRLVLLVLTLIMCLGVSYAAIYFVELKEDTRENELETGLISINYQEGSSLINLEDTVPVIDEIGLENEPYIFTVKNTSIIPINLKFEVVPSNNSQIPAGAIRYGLYINDELIKKGNLTNDEALYTLLNFEPNETINAKLILWVDYYYENPGETFSATVKVTGESFDIIAPELGSDKLKKAIVNNTDSSCTPYVEEDGIIYLSGTNDCVDFNYVWYSGKLWRITAIYPDGTIKMITDSAITTIAYGEDTNFYTDENNKSYMYQWLNEDFLDTLYNYQNIIVTDYKWNATSGNGDITYKLPTTVEEGATLVSAPVGLLNSYEYYKSFQNTSNGRGYLNIGYYWWLLNRYITSSSNVWNVSNSDDGINYSPSGASGGRPSINLKSTIQLSSGSGTKTEPYKIKGDKEEAVVNTTLLNTRQSGEYVKFAEEGYRIVGTEVIVDSDTNEEKTITKLNKLDYVRDESNTVITKKFASSVTFGLTTNTQSEDYWDYYLNNTWKTAIDDTYEGMLVEGTYYLGKTSNNYKLSICQAASNTVTTKDCEKTTSTWTGYVGLPRYGEMFASQQGSGYSSSSNMWLITPDNYSSLWDVNSRGPGSNYIPSYTHGGRPSINLTSEVVITGGEGTPNSPYEIALPN